jgi:hypothetical protein
MTELYWYIFSNVKLSLHSWESTCSVTLCFYFCFCLILCDWGLNSALLAKQMLYLLSHTCSPFCSGYFGWDLVNYLYRLTILPIAASQVAGIIGVSHQHLDNIWIRNFISICNLNRPTIFCYIYFKQHRNKCYGSFSTWFGHFLLFASWNHWVRQGLIYLFLMLLLTPFNNL